MVPSARPLDGSLWISEAATSTRKPLAPNYSVPSRQEETRLKVIHLPEPSNP